MATATISTSLQKSGDSCFQSEVVCLIIKKNISTSTVDYTYDE